MSSANKRNVEVETTSGRSLMYTRNNSGHNTVPCGTPENTSSFTDSHPSTSTCCVLEDKKDVIGLHSDKVYEVHNILTDCQHGFRSRRSCVSQLISTIQGIAEKLK
jgi:hypothetical protein